MTKRGNHTERNTTQHRAYRCLAYITPCILRRRRAVKIMRSTCIRKNDRWLWQWNQRHSRAMSCSLQHISSSTATRLRRATDVLSVSASSVVLRTLFVTVDLCQCKNFSVNITPCKGNKSRIKTAEIAFAGIQQNALAELMEPVIKLRS